MTEQSLRLFNSLDRRIEPVAVAGPTVGVYVCGITPYDATHLGHAFTYTTFDVLLRYLRFNGHQVRYVQNVTDVDDDILRRARSLEVDWRDLGNSEVEKFLRDSDALNNLRPDIMPRATAHIDEVKAMVTSLLAGGVAYESQGNVYFEVSKAASFGARLLRSDREHQLELANERGNFPDDPAKRDPLDFVLWQRSQQDEPAWSSPWSDGRPGWHIECSALSKRYLGPTFAIHGGGSDLLFPHHECEIAQGEFANGHIPAHHWVHVGMVRYEGEKMSKSLGNMVFVSDLLRSFDSDVIRFLLLSHHYRSSWEFEESELEEARRRFEQLKPLMDQRGAPSDSELAEFGGGITSALTNDLDTPRALAEIEAMGASSNLTERKVANWFASEVLGLRVGKAT